MGEKDEQDDGLSATFLTTRQVAALLHVKERKIYDLAAGGEIPATRAGGKWLFHRAALFDWLESQGNATGFSAKQAPNVILGSHDPLLEWSVRQSGCGIATWLDGSMDGLLRLAAGEGIAAGIHIPDLGASASLEARPEGLSAGNWNRIAAHQLLENEPVVLIEWAWRERGLLVAAGNPLAIGNIADLPAKRLVPRQQGAGSQLALLAAMKEAKIAPEDCQLLPAARSEEDAALAVAEGAADAAFGLRCMAARNGLDFVPVLRERFDLLVNRRDWFEPPLQTLFAFARTPEFASRADTLTGYDISGLGQVHANGR